MFVFRGEEKKCTLHTHEADHGSVLVKSQMKSQKANLDCPVHTTLGPADHLISMLYFLKYLSNVSVFEEICPNLLWKQWT